MANIAAALGAMAVGMVIGVLMIQLILMRARRTGTQEEHSAQEGLDYLRVRGPK